MASCMVEPPHSTSCPDSCFAPAFAPPSPFSQILPDPPRDQWKPVRMTLTIQSRQVGEANVGALSSIRPLGWGLQEGRAGGQEYVELFAGRGAEGGSGWRGGRAKGSGCSGIGHAQSLAVPVASHNDSWVVILNHPVTTGGRSIRKDGRGGCSW